MSSLQLKPLTKTLFSDDEYDEEQEYVTLDKVDDKDGEEPNSTESRGGEDEAGKDKTASGSDSKKDGDLAKVKKEEIGSFINCKYVKIYLVWHLILCFCTFIILVAILFGSFIKSVYLL